MGKVMFAPKELDERNEPTHNCANSAGVCRSNGWAVGTRLIGDEGYGYDIIEITAIGRSMLGAACGHYNFNDEGSWTLSCRDWHRVDSPAGKWIAEHSKKGY